MTKQQFVTMQEHLDGGGALFDLPTPTRNDAGEWVFIPLKEATREDLEHAIQYFEQEEVDARGHLQVLRTVFESDR